METKTQQLHTAISNTIPDAIIDIRTEDDHHFQITVTSDDFINKTKVAQHQLVYSGIQELIDQNIIHAVELNTQTISSIKEKITKLISNNPIIIFMKGTKLWPQCGFSGKAIDLLNFYQVNYKTYDILNDEAIRQVIKSHSNWPTFPQIYVSGELVGGYDILKEMHENNELKSILTTTEC